MARRRKGSRGHGGGGFTLTGFILKLLFTVVIVVLILTLVQCTVRKPQAPTWNTQLIVPLVNRIYAMPELISKMDQSEIGFDVDSNIIFSVSRDLDTFRLQPSDLSVGGMSYSVSQQLGALSLQTPDIDPVTVPLSSIAPLAAGLGGDIPPTTFSIANDLPQLTTMTAATVSSGGVYVVVVTNHLGIGLASVTATLHDVHYGIDLGTHSFAGGVPNGESDSILFDISGTTISNQLRADLACTTDSGTLLSSGVQEVTTGVSFSSPFEVSAATAQVPALSRDFSQNVALAKSNAVYSATLSGGTLSLDVSNNTILASSLSMTFPDIVQNNQPLVIARNVGAHASTLISQDLTGWTIVPRDSSLPQSIGIEIAASSPGSGSNQVVIDQSQSFSVSADISSLTLGSVTGVIPATDVNIDPVDQSIDVPQGFDSIQLAHATLRFEITNAVDLNGSLAIHLHGNNGKSLDIAGIVTRGSTGNPAISVVSDTTIADFLWPLPSQLTVTGAASFGDGVTTGTLTSQDFVHAKVSIEAPLELIVHQSSVRPDISRQKLDSSSMDNIANHVTEARLVYTLNNHLPLGAHFNLYLGGDSATTYSNPQVLIDNLFIHQAQVDGSGLVTTAVSTGEQSVILDSADIQVIRHPSLWTGSEIVLDSSGGQPVKLTAHDYVEVVARLEIQYVFDGKF